MYKISKPKDRSSLEITIILKCFCFDSVIECYGYNFNAGSPHDYNMHGLCRFLQDHNIHRLCHEVKNCLGRNGLHS